MVQWMKFSEEKTNVSVSNVERGDFDLPSMTICPEYWGENPPQGNITFQEFMEGVLDESNFFLYAEQNIYLPGKM